MGSPAPAAVADATGGRFRVGMGLVLTVQYVHVVTYVRVDTWIFNLHK